MRKTISVILVAIIMANLLVFSASAQQAKHSDTLFSVENIEQADSLYDGDRKTYATVKKDTAITLERQDGIAHIYIEFDRLPTGWSLVIDGNSIECGKENFLHDYVDVKNLTGNIPTKVELKFPENTVIADIYGFSQGELPDFVQIWNAPCEKADLLLISSHSDDEQLFFAGVLPYYAIERKLNVQVAYMVQHFELDGEQNHSRPHEQLDGLWTVGVKNYPVMSNFPDVYSESKDSDIAFKEAEEAFLEKGVTYDDFKAYITELLRRFKPLVVVSHDLNGEYGHGTHVLCASALTEAVLLAQEKENYPQSAQEYGVWQTQKVYLHLYDANKIIMDWDKPLESLGGKTAFQKTQEGFGFHKSQHWTWFYDWIYGKDNQITKASQIEKYSPCEYGLFYTTVGIDTIGGDFMENVISHSELEAQQNKPDQPVMEEITETESYEQQPQPTENGTGYKNAIVFLAVFAIGVSVALIIALLVRRAKIGKGSQNK